MHPNLDAANVILGIKEPPLDRLNLSPTPSAGLTTRARTHMMFSHTAKGQSYNTPLLSTFLSGQHPGRDQHQDLPTLIDFEYLTDDKGKRTVGFGWFAGGKSPCSHIPFIFSESLSSCGSIGIPVVYGSCSSRTWRRVTVSCMSPTRRYIGW